MRFDGTIVPRNRFVGRPIDRVETRVQQQVPLTGRASINVYAEVCICSITRTSEPTT